MPRVARTAAARGQRGRVRALPNRALARLQRERAAKGKQMKAAKAMKASKAAASATKSGIKKPHRYRPGTVALRGIRQEQKLVKLIIPKLPSQRLLKDMTQQLLDEIKYWAKMTTPRMQATTVECLQHASEARLIGTFEDANLCAIHANHVTTMSKDLTLAIRPTNNP